MKIILEFFFSLTMTAKYLPKIIAYLLSNDVDICVVQSIGARTRDVTEFL